MGPKTTHSWLLTCALSLALAQPCVSSSQVIDHISEQYEAFFKSLNMQPTIAADGGFADAQSNLGILYHEGKVTPQDLGEALKGLRLAAFQNQPRAVYVLGVMYRDGRSVPKDEGEAVRLFKRDAEELRYPPAENTLGSLYYLGRGVPKDLVLAYMWESVAIDAGYEPARKALQTMSDGMTAEQISEAIQRSHEWMNSPPTVAGSPSVAAATIETNP